MIKTTVKVLEKYIETRLNFYFFFKLQLLLMPLYSSILSGELSSWNIIFLREKKGTKPDVGVIYQFFIFLGYEDYLFLSLTQLKTIHSCSFSLDVPPSWIVQGRFWVCLCQILKVSLFLDWHNVNFSDYSSDTMLVVIYWWPQKDMSKSSPLVLINVTLFGNKIFADGGVVKDLDMRQFWL